MAAPKVGVIFDCDGTLIDSMGAWRAVEEGLAKTTAGVGFTSADTDALTTMSIPECGWYLHHKFGLGSSALDVASMITDQMLVFYSTEAQPRPGALELVRGLHERGVPLAVASSTPRPLLEVALAHTGFTPHLAAIHSVDDVGSSKREPAVYDLCRQTLGTPRRLTWGVEDAIYAIRTLNAAGYRSCAVYDCDESGTWRDLSREARLAARSFQGLAPADFLV